MSRIGKQPVQLSGGAKARQKDGKIFIEGPKGKLEQTIPDGITVTIEDTELRVQRASNSRRHRSLHGLTRSLISNMVTGVTEGYSKTLWVVGVGYGAKKQGNKLLLQTGFANSLEYEIPKDVEVADITTSSLPAGARSIPMAVVTVSGPDKQVVGQFAAMIRNSRPPEPYQGKGVRYANEQIRRKAGKRFGATAGVGG